MSVWAWPVRSTDVIRELVLVVWLTCDVVGGGGLGRTVGGVVPAEGGTVPADPQRVNATHEQHPLSA